MIGGLLTPLGLIQAIAKSILPPDIQAGLAVIKLRLLRELRGLGVRLHEIEPARLIHPKDGPAAGYYHRHPDPMVPVCWRIDEIAPSVEQAIVRYGGASPESRRASKPTRTSFIGPTEQSLPGRTPE